MELIYQKYLQLFPPLCICLSDLCEAVYLCGDPRTPFCLYLTKDVEYQTCQPLMPCGTKQHHALFDKPIFLRTLPKESFANQTVNLYGSVLPNTNVMTIAVSTTEITPITRNSSSTGSVIA